MTPADEPPPTHPTPPLDPPEPGAPRDVVDSGQNAAEPRESVRSGEDLRARQPGVAVPQAEAAEAQRVVLRRGSLEPEGTLWSRDPAQPREGIDPAASVGDEPPVQPKQGGGSGGRAILVGTLLVVAALAGTGLGFVVALPGLLPGPSIAPGPAQPSYVIDTHATPAPTREAAVPAASPVPLQYTVEAGDTLRSIADKLYGDADLWPMLYDANRDVIGSDPDALRVGMRLRAPSREG